MKLFPYNLRATEEIEDCLDKFLQECPEEYRSILCLLFSADDNTNHISAVRQAIQARVPAARIAGCTSSGEIMDGELRLESIQVTFLVFDRSTVDVHLFDCAKLTMDEAAAEILPDLLESEPLAGIGILTTLKTLNDIHAFTDVLASLPPEVPIFGGSSDSYNNKSSYVNDEYTCVFDDESFTNQGILAILFHGEDLHIRVSSYNGWKPLGAETVITGMKGCNEVTHLNQKPVVSLYEKYLGIAPGERFFSAIIPFPVMIDRDEHPVARMAISYSDDGSMRFGGDFNLGEHVRLGYGDPISMLQDGQQNAIGLYNFQPEGILLFSCIVRRMYLRDDVSNELKTFRDIAPSAGFYTYGELQRFEGHSQVHLLNGSMVTTCFREGRPQTKAAENVETQKLAFHDERISLITGLAHFVSVTTMELEQANRALTHLADTDRLTGLLNRGAVEQILKREIERSDMSFNLTLGAIMVDLDHFKRINDTFGHEVGDEVLRTVAKVMQGALRSSDYVGRWGGEEFMLVLPGCNLKDAVMVAERIRTCISEQTILPDGSHATASLGVTVTNNGDTLDGVYGRLDDELYKAKRLGRNRVSATRGNL
ncbi:diguanylate cyclase [Selenomonas sp. GACV-9]|uniref:sensor domain-containing diguanylate cyclase n=1 Tax=Selenomonas sp. GACV-9 TaxID=3158782 RepID=UPI00094D2724